VKCRRLHEQGGDHHGNRKLKALQTHIDPWLLSSGCVDASDREFSRSSGVHFYAQLDGLVPSPTTW
jgi:hypothetical protein